MKSYNEIINKKDVSILITGDSLAFNRYGYDPVHRGNFDVYEYGAGMQSWAFSLRDKLYKDDKNFILGSELKFNCESALGIDNVSGIPNTAMFNGEIKTLMPKEDVEFVVPFDSEEIILYLQNRIDNPCVFDISVDGKVVLSNVNTLGDIKFFAGYALNILRLPCENRNATHTVRFINIRGENAKITVAAVGSVYRKIVLNGRGSQCISFFIENFEERILNHKPDLIILSLIGNDRVRVAPEVVRQQLIELFGKIFENLPECKVLFLLPTSSHNPDDPEQDIIPHTSLLTAEVYNRTVERVCANLGKEGYSNNSLKSDGEYDIEVMRISSLFDNDNVSQWRFDTIHLNHYGNKVLCNTLLEKFNMK